MSESPDPLCVPVADIDREDSVNRDWALSCAWFSTHFEDTEVEPVGDKPGQVRLNVFKSGRQFVVRGQLRAHVQVPCARTLDPAEYLINTELFLVFEPLAATDGRGPKRSERQKKSRKNSAEDEQLLTGEEAAHESFSGDEIRLSPFIREQILLEIPMFPLRSDLRSLEAPAMRPPSEDPEPEAEVDSRLLPLKTIAEQLRTKKG